MAPKKVKSAYTAENAAKYFIFLASRVVGVEAGTKAREGISNLKLQKILYFAQAYFLATQNRPLFSDKIEAWGYGPVVPKLYSKYKTYGSKAMISEKDESTILEEDKKILDKVWDAFGGFSAGRLVDITHAHAPWKEAYNSLDKEIKQEVLGEYYKPLFSK